MKNKNKVRRVSIWETADGRTHLFESEAKAHQHKLDLHQIVYALDDAIEHWPSVTQEQIAEAILAQFDVEKIEDNGKI